MTSQDMGEGEGARICAIVVSFNRAALLAETLDSVLGQTQACDILVVDNASTDNSRCVIEKIKAGNARVRTLYLSKNIGGAGGFHTGLKEAWGLGYQQFWLLDDDTVADVMALARLVTARDVVIASAGRPPAFVCSNVRWRDGTACRMNVPALARDWLDMARNGLPYLPVRYASFVSLLVSREAVKTFGLPLHQYFIWFDDSEFTHRISKETPGLLVLDSLVEHKTPRNDSTGLDLVNEDNLWKYEYGYRNQASFILQQAGLRKYLKFLKKAVFFRPRAMLAWRSRLRLIKAILKGYRFRPPVEYP